MGKKKKQVNIFFILLCLVLVIYSFCVLALVLWAVITSLKTNTEFLIKKNFFGLPKQIEFQNYIDVFVNFSVPVTRKGVPLIITMDYQLIYTLIYSIGGSFLTAFAAYMMAFACAKFKFGFNRVIEVAALVSMVLPIVGSQTSMVSFLHELAIYDTMVGVLAQKFIYSSLYFFILTGLIKKVPSALSEAAEIDGMGEFGIMVHIIFPLMRNAFFTIVLIYFMQYWNDYQTPMLYMPSYPTIAYGIYNLVYVNTTPLLNVTPKKMAGCIILIVPIIIVFMIFRNKLMSNLSAGSVKG